MNFRLLNSLLFNFQGAAFLPRGQLNYFTTSSSLCQYLFSTFFEIFFSIVSQRLDGLVPRSRRVLDYYNIYICACQEDLTNFFTFSHLLKFNPHSLPQNRQKHNTTILLYKRALLQNKKAADEPQLFQLGITFSSSELLCKPEHQRRWKVQRRR